jgi:hypothetical protein
MNPSAPVAPLAKMTPKVHANKGRSNHTKLDSDKHWPPPASPAGGKKLGHVGVSSLALALILARMDSGDLMSGTDLVALVPTILKPGSIHQQLHRLAEDGFIECITSRKESLPKDFPLRDLTDGTFTNRFYRITGKGSKALHDVKALFTAPQTDTLQQLTHT